MFKPFFPPHIYQKDKIYFLTARTFNKEVILKTDSQKQIFYDVLRHCLKEFDVQIFGWTINLDHYHLLLYFKNRNIKNFIKKLHGKTSYLLNKFDGIKGRRVWVNYWDRCVRSERDFYVRLNYIHHNCVKHGYVKSAEEYKWSSYQQYIKKYGLEWADDCFSRYPIVDFTLEEGAGPD